MHTYTLYLQIDPTHIQKERIDHTIAFYNKVIAMWQERQAQREPYVDAGFDLPLLRQHKVTYGLNKIPLGVSAKMVRHDVTGREIPVSYYLYPRSSLSKTPFRLANSVGIIDSGYRGQLCAMVDVIDTMGDIPDEIESGVYLFQLCAPDLSRISKVEMVTSLESTDRGSGGFGSTGNTFA